MRKVAFLRSAGRVAGLVALGIAPLLVAVSGLRLSAPDGTLIWEPPAIPEMTFSITVGQRPPPAGRQAENPQPARVGSDLLGNFHPAESRAFGKVTPCGGV